MKTISLQKAFELLQDCSAIIIDNIVTYPSLDEICNDKDNEFLYISWEDDGLEFCTKFTEENNQTVKINDNVMFLTDYEGDEIEIKLLCPMELEKV